MGENAAILGAPWRLRSVTLIASVIVVCAACLLLYLSSRRTAFEESWSTAGVEVLLAPKPATQAQPRPQSARVLGAPSLAAPPRAADAVLAQMLVCFGPRRNAHAECPHTQRPPDLRTGSELAIGSEFAPVPETDFNAGLTRGEQMTIRHEEPCGVLSGGHASGCARLPPPPGPSRTAEEICEAGGLGPCHPPPFREAVHGSPDGRP